MAFKMTTSKYDQLKSRIVEAQKKWGVYKSGQKFEETVRGRGEITTNDPNHLKEAVDKAAKGASVSASTNPEYSPHTPIQDFWGGLEGKITEVLNKSTYVPPSPSYTPSTGGGGCNKCDGKAGCFGSKC